jgi:hypothetical protein
MKKTQTLLGAAILAAAAILTACTPAMMMVRGTGAGRPAPSEFGLGPRPSAGGRYIATLESARPLGLLGTDTLRLLVRDAEGRPIGEAQIAVDGGMPQYRHRLPEEPRVTMNVSDGVYAIDGVRFDMGGWWELRLAIAGSRGADTVTFNLEL